MGDLTAERVSAGGQVPPHSRAHTRWGGGGATVPGQLGRDRSGQIRQRQGVHGGWHGARGWRV